MKKLLLCISALLLAIAAPARAQILTTTSGHLTSPPLSLSQKWQGMGQGMEMTVQGFQSATIRSSLNRTPHYSNVAFRYFRVVIPVSYSVCGTVCADQLYQGTQATLSFQVGFEYPYALATTGLAARVPVTWGGANYQTYSYAGWTGPGYIVSDVIDAGQTIPAGAKFGLWTTIEGPAATAGMIPYLVSGTNFFQRYLGISTSTSSQIAGLGGASDVALNATSITAQASAQSGYADIFTPAFLLIEVPSATKMVAGLGDSIMYGVGEGSNSADTTSGDAMGDANDNMGYEARWIVEGLGMNFVNFGRGTDAFKFLATAANWKYRQQLLALANPTDILSQNGHNDIGAGVSAATLLGYAQTTYAIIRRYLPGVTIVQTTITPDSTTTNAFATTGGETASVGFGASSSARGTFNDSYVRTTDSALGNSGFVDPDPALEYGYSEGSAASETSLWNVTGSSYGYTYDGHHPDSYGAMTAAANIKAYDASGTLVTNPF